MNTRREQVPEKRNMRKRRGEKIQINSKESARAGKKIYEGLLHISQERLDGREASLREKG